MVNYKHSIEVLIVYRHWTPNTKEEDLMSTVTYTSKVSRPITYQWKCSKCGKINRVSTTIKTRGETMSFGRKINAESQNRASFMAQSQMQGIVGALFGERERFYKYKGLGLNRGCDKCKNKEPWAVTNTEGLLTFLIKVGVIALFVAGICVIFSILLLLGGNLTSTQRANNVSLLLTWLGIAGGIVASYFIYKYLNDKYEEKKDREISALPISSLPVLVINDQPVVDIDYSEPIKPEKEKKANPIPPRESIPQQKESNKHTAENQYSAADEIEKFKGLLDKGIITQEEFDAKKKQLLGL